MMKEERIIKALSKHYGRDILKLDLTSSKEYGLIYFMINIPEGDFFSNTLKVATLGSIVSQNGYTQCLFHLDESVLIEMKEWKELEKTKWLWPDFGDQ